METSALSAWILYAMKSWIPIALHVRAGYASEDVEEHYEQLAVDIANYALDEEVTPIFDGESGRARTALFLAAIPASETGFNVVWDAGGTLVKGDNDNGQAVGPWQTWWRGNPQGWSRTELAEDRTKELELAAMRIRESVRACKWKAPETWLTGYASGKFDCSVNKKGAAHTKRALDWWRAHPFM